MFNDNEDEEEEDRMSSMSEIFNPDDEKKFIKVYNNQGHYSASQSVVSVFFKVSD